MLYIVSIKWLHHSYNWCKYFYSVNSQKLYKNHSKKLLLVNLLNLHVKNLHVKNLQGKIFKRI